MAKFEEASEDVVKIFDEVRDNTTIPQWIEFKVLCNNKQKVEPCKLFKTNDLVEVLTEGVNFVVVFNEKIFFQLPNDMQRITIDECLAGVCVNENDVISLGKPDFNTHTGVLQKYGDSNVIALHESIKSLYDAEKQKEDELKAQSKAKKSKKS
jgi:ribosomal protein S4E